MIFQTEILAVSVAISLGPYSDETVNKHNFSVSEKTRKIETTEKRFPFSGLLFTQWHVVKWPNNLLICQRLRFAEEKNDSLNLSGRHVAELIEINYLLLVNSLIFNGNNLILVKITH